jgi:ribonuclease BN (tRNA processing enzyme)
MRAECQFAKAGQGLFYNGILVDKDGHTFSFVYDCGTFGAAQVLANSVDEYRSFTKKRLDILFISHLYRDHISHIPKLIENIELNQVVLPNVLPEIRLLLAARSDDIETNNELISFYGNPAKYFAERGAKQVILLNYDDDNNEPLYPIEDNSEYRSDIRENHEASSIEDRNKIIVYSRSGMMNEVSLFNTKIEESKGVVDFLMPHYSWEFREINIHYKRYDDTFLDEVRELLADNDNDFNKLLRNSEQVEALRKIYDEHFDGNLNDTSVIVRSYPIHRGHVIDHDGVQHFRATGDKDKFREHFIEHGHAETLLLGDITMDFKIFDHLLYRYLEGIEYLPRVIQLPHHGARIRCHPMCCDVVHYIGRNGLYSEFVASYGMTNSYGHPDLCWHRKCGDLCFDRCPSIRLVNERSDFTYTVMYE